MSAPTNIELLAQVTEAIGALQNGQGQAVKAVEKLGIHETDPLAHGIDRSTSPFRQTVCTIATETAQKAALDEVIKQLATTGSDLKETISDAVDRVAGSISPDSIGALPANGNAESASKLETARTIALTGPVAGSVDFDGSGNVTLVTSESSQALGAIRGAVSLNLASGLYISATITGSTTLTMTNVPNGVVAVLLELTNGGSAVVTWGMSPRWSNGVPPVLTASGVDLVALYRSNGAWSGVLVASNLR